MRLRNPRAVWKRLKETNQSVATAAIDAKLTKLRSIPMSHQENIIEYVNSLDNSVNELHDAGHVKLNFRLRRALLLGLHKVFPVIDRAIWMSDRSLNDAVSHLIVEKSFKDETDCQQKAKAANYQSQGSNLYNNPECYRCGKKGLISRSYNSGKACQYCGKARHVPKHFWNYPDGAF